MCHEIYPRKKDFRFLQFFTDSIKNLFLVGTKELLLKEERIGGLFYPWKNVKYSKTKYGIKIEMPVQEQEIRFYLPFYPISRKISAGIHISPVFLNYIDTNEIIVLFKPKEVVFFDGINVSVKSFIIPNKDVAKDIIDFLKITPVGEDDTIEKIIWRQRRYYKAVSKHI